MKNALQLRNMYKGNWGQLGQSECEGEGCIVSSLEALLVSHIGGQDGMLLVENGLIVKYHCCMYFRLALGIWKITGTSSRVSAFDLLRIWVRSR